MFDIVRAQSTRPLRRLKDKLAWARRNLSPGDAVLYCLSRGARSVCSKLRLEKSYLMAQPVCYGEPAVPQRRDGISVRLLANDPQLFTSFPQPPAVIAQRLGDNCLCLVATKDDAFCGYLWLCFGSYYEAVDRCLMTPVPEVTTAWDFDIYVEPEYRLTTTFRKLWREANRCLSERGVTWSLSRISAFNPASLASHRRLGAVKVASLLFLGCGRFQVMLAGVRPYLHVAVSSKRYPRIRVPAPESR